MAMKSSSVCALEPEKITKTKRVQYCGTPCTLRSIVLLIATLCPLSSQLLIIENDPLSSKIKNSMLDPENHKKKVSLIYMVDIWDNILFIYLRYIY